MLATAEELGVELPTVAASWRANRMQIDMVRDFALEGVDEPRDAVVALLGLSFKPDTDDIRESQAIHLADRLVVDGVTIRAHDPVAIERARSERAQLLYFEDPYEAATGAHTVVIATEWPQFRELDWARVATLMAGRQLVDGRNLLDPAAMRELGFDYRSVGRTTAAGRAQAISVSEAEFTT